MIRSDLKVGDIFEDGGKKFKVTKVVSKGVYESQRIKADAPVKEEPKEEIKELPFTTVEEKQAQLDSFNTYTKTEIKRLSNKELTALCEKLDITPGSGVEMKKAIIEKLGL